MNAKNGLELTPQLRNAIIAKRLSLGLTYCALGRFLGVSWATVRKWEQGRVKMCHVRHRLLIREFLKGYYDENFHNSMDAKNIGAYIHEVPTDIVECLQRFQNSHRILRARPDLQMKLLASAFTAVKKTLHTLLGVPDL